MTPRKVAVALALGLLLSACDGGGANRDTPAREADTPSDSVLTEIRTSNDCGHLQNLFDVAAEAHDFANENNALDAMQAMTARMSAADDRMREIGCYD